MSSSTESTSRVLRRGAKGIALALAPVVVGLGLLGAGQLPSAAAADPSSDPSASSTPSPTDQPGYAGPCTDDRGVTVVVDFQDLSPHKDTVVRCAPDFPEDGTGLDALERAGIVFEGTVRWGPAFICRLEGRPAADETISIPQNPAYKEPCVNTPPTAAFWSYWWAENGGQWTYSDSGAATHKAAIGGWEGWSFSHNASADTNPVPRVTPSRQSNTPSPTPSSTPPPKPDTPITVKWKSTGGATGGLGRSIRPEDCTLINRGCFEVFQKGSIYDSASTDPHWVRGAIRDAWGRLGWERGALGYPTSDEFCGLRDGGCAQRFQGGILYWSPSTGAHPVWGVIGERYAAMRWETSALGYPTSDEFCGLRDGGCGQHFQGGSLYFSPRSGAWPSWGLIRDHWARNGWEAGRYGYPVGHESCRPGECRQTYQHGVITWNAARGTF